MSSGPAPLSLLGGRVTGYRQLSDDSGNNPLVVFIHGGGSNAGETLIPGHSQLTLAAQNGFSAFAFDRPSYGGSEGLGFAPGSEDGLFAANARRMSEAIDEIWAEHGTDAAGVVVHGCSLGGAIALHLAAQWSADAANGLSTWPLLGVAVGDIGQQPPQEVVDAWHATPVQEILPDMRLLFGSLTLPPLWTMPQSPMPDMPAPIPRAELMEVVGAWPRDWRKVAESIAVPIRYRLAQHDTAWVANDELVREFASALSTSSPYVDARISVGASHGIFGGIMGDAYNLGVLAFVAFCAAAAETPEVLAA